MFSRLRKRKLEKHLKNALQKASVQDSVVYLEIDTLGVSTDQLVQHVLEYEPNMKALVAHNKSNGVCCIWCKEVTTTDYVETATEMLGYSMHRSSKCTLFMTFPKYSILVQNSILHKVYTVVYSTVNPQEVEPEVDFES